jgi:hypothetical protein
MHRSHTPSPERSGLSRTSVLAAVPTANPTMPSDGGPTKPPLPPLGIVVTNKESVDDEDDHNEEESIRTPIRPSAKALGKRRLIEAEETDRKLFPRFFFTPDRNLAADAFNPDDIFYERTDARDARNAATAPDDSGISDSDSDSAHRVWPQQPVHYAYDAVAERTQRLLQQMSLVNGVH